VLPPPPRYFPLFPTRRRQDRFRPFSAVNTVSSAGCARTCIINASGSYARIEKTRRVSSYIILLDTRIESDHNSYDIRARAQKLHCVLRARRGRVRPENQRTFLRVRRLCETRVIIIGIPRWFICCAKHVSTVTTHRRTRYISCHTLVFIRLKRLMVPGSNAVNKYRKHVPRTRP